MGHEMEFSGYSILEQCYILKTSRVWKVSLGPSNKNDVKSTGDSLMGSGRRKGLYNIKTDSVKSHG